MDNNYDLTLKKINSALVFVSGKTQAIIDLENYFKARSKNYRNNKSFKSGWWDGYIRHFDTSHQYLPIGLVNEVYVFARKGGYKLHVDFTQVHELKYDFFLRFVDALNIKIRDRYGKVLPDERPREYQLKAAYEALRYQHLNIEIPTSGGKTLISYMIARYLHARNKKMIMVVPTTTLVEQSYSDWFDYGWDYVRDHVHRVHGGHEKYFGAAVTISTWQSIYTKPEIFEEFDCLLVDESHGSDAKSLNNIAKWCCNAEWRLGMSGTLPSRMKFEELNSYYGIVGALGPIKVYTTYAEMQQEEWIPKIHIYPIILKYSEPTRRQLAYDVASMKEEYRNKITDEALRTKMYNYEIDTIHNLEERNKFIISLIERTCTKNVMILFTKVEKHGKVVKEVLEEHFKGKRRVLYVDGSVKTADRDAFRHITDRTDGIILLASYGTLSTGVSIKNVHYVVLASSYKSKVKVLQTIGRGLRKMEGKDELKVFDLVDDLTFTEKNMHFVNATFKQSKERENIYREKKLKHTKLNYKI